MRDALYVTAMIGLYGNYETIVLIVTSSSCTASSDRRIILSSERVIFDRSLVIS